MVPLMKQAASSGKKMEHIRVRVTAELKAALKDMAERNRRSEMDLARVLLELQLGLITEDDLKLHPRDGPTKSSAHKKHA